METNYNKSSFVCYGKETDPFVFIISPGLRSENIPLYKYIQDETENIVIPIDKLQDTDMINELKVSINKQVTIETYLKEYTKYLTTNYTRKIPLVDNEEAPVLKIKKTKKIPIKPSEDEILLQQQLNEQLLNAGPVKKTRKQKSKVFVEKKNKTRKNKNPLDNNELNNNELNNNELS
jgi:hypothetical protein